VVPVSLKKKFLRLPVPSGPRRNHSEGPAAAGEL